MALGAGKFRWGEDLFVVKSMIKGVHNVAGDKREDVEIEYESRENGQKLLITHNSVQSR